MNPRRWYCVACEVAAVEPTSLGFIGNDGAIGSIDGWACAACLRIWETPGAIPRITGYIDLGGRPAIDVLLERFTQHGCDPRPVVEP